MNTPLRLLVWLVYFILPTALLRANDRQILWSIGQIETGGRAAIGAGGETGVTQMSPNTRAEHQSNLDYLHWIRRELLKAGYPPTVYNLALAWNAGIGRIKAHHCQPRHWDFAQRVTNTYEAYGQWRP